MDTFGTGQIRSLLEDELLTERHRAIIARIVILHCHHQVREHQPVGYTDEDYDQALAYLQGHNPGFDPAAFYLYAIRGPRTRRPFRRG